MMEIKDDLAKLILRLALGGLFILHGFPKMMAGPKLWQNLGQSMANFYLDFYPVFWGFMAAFSEFFGAILLIFGFLTPLASSLLAATMFVATSFHYFRGDSFLHSTSRPLELMFVFIALAMLGAGKFSLDQKLFAKKNDT